MKKQYGILMMGAALFLASCQKDFLNTQPIDFISPDNFSSEKDVELAVNGIYKALVLDSRDPVFLDFMTDNGFMDKAFSGEIEFWDQSQNPNSIIAESKWDNSYQGILRANTVIKYTPDVRMGEELKKQKIGEALFLRAYFYLYLTELYGDVPYRKEPEGLEKKDSPRVSKEIIVDDMLKDLDSAASWLKPTYTGVDIGRATSGAALALKARYLLYNEKWEDAAKACQDVIDLKVHSLYSSYSGLFNINNENNPEVLFDIQFLKNQSGRGLSSSWYTYFYNWSSYMGLANLEREYYMTNGKHIEAAGSGYQVNKPWLNRDPRLAVNFTLPYTMDGYNANGTDKLYIPNAKKASNFSSLRIRKWVDYTDNGLNSVSGLNVILLRYADVLLMRAEALLKSGGDRDEVVSLINQVRQRPTVMMPKVEDSEGTNLTDEQLENIIKHERRVEFAFEGTRIFDIKRWDLGADVITNALGYRPEKLITSQNSSTYELYAFRSRAFNTKKGYLWPIPTSEIQSNKAIINNNPGY